MRAPQGLGLKLRKYLVNNMDGGSDIINANLNPIVINDTTAVTTTANSYTQVKSYSNIGGIENWYGKYMVNAIRIQVYGYVSAGTGYVEIEVDGATSYTVLKAITGTATGTSFTNTSSALLIDAIIELSASSSHTIAILAYNSTSGDSTTIADVYGFQGYALTATSLTEIDSETLSNYILDEIGFKYDADSGIHAVAYVNRSTSATATLQFADNFTPSGNYGVTLTAPAGNDAANAGYWAQMTDNNGNESVPTGYNGSWSWSAYGEVGASGDVLLIGELYIWFAPHQIFPPTDLLLTVDVQMAVIPGYNSVVYVGTSEMINLCATNSLYCGASAILYTVLSITNSSSSTSSGPSLNSAGTPIIQLTTDEFLVIAYSGRGILFYLEVAATVV